MNELNELLELFPGYFVNRLGEVLSTKKGKIRQLKPVKNPVNGYLYIGLTFSSKKVKYYSVHRLIGSAFLGLDLSNPKSQINHINSIKTDNRVENLEVCSSRENNTHKTLTLNTSSQYTGVYWSGDHSKWKAKIHINKKSRFLGYFTTELEASNAYQTALRLLK